MPKHYRILNLLVISFCLILIAGCAQQKAVFSSYADGSGNLYVIKNVSNVKTLEYIPVKPSDSGSGDYDGGEYVKKEISEADYKKILSRVGGAVRNKENHVEFRPKGSGLISLQTNGKELQYLLAYNSKEQLALEKTLKKIINNNNHMDISSPISKENLGKKITLEGKAVDAKEGAMLLMDKGTIFIDNLDSWPTGLYLGGDNGKKVRVTGTLIEKHDLPVFVQKNNEPISAGIPVPEGTDLEAASQRFLLKDATWELIKE